METSSVLAFAESRMICFYEYFSTLKRVSKSKLKIFLAPKHETGNTAFVASKATPFPPQFDIVYAQAEACG